MGEFIMDYRWLNNVNPDESESFKWNFMRDMVKPQMNIQGPSVGSLLYALNPETSELGLKQMDNELNLQLKANEDFDKRGQNALKFMEDRVQEDIKRKQLNNVDAGHANSTIGNLAKAYEGGNEMLIKLAEEQAKKLPNAELIMAQAAQAAQASIKQKNNYQTLTRDMPQGDSWATVKDRNKKIQAIQEARENGLINDEQENEAIKLAYSIPSRDIQSAVAVRNAINTYNAQKAAGDAANTDYDNWLVEAKKKYPGQNETFYKGLYDRERNRGK